MTSINSSCNSLCNPSQIFPAKVAAGFSAAVRLLSGETAEPGAQHGEVEFTEDDIDRIFEMVADNSAGINAAIDKDVLIALSGGPDSCALLFALNAVAVELHLKLHACHINHGLRGAESDRDEQFCREICEQLEIPLCIRRIEREELDRSKRMEPDAMPPSQASEESLRDARYEFLNSVAQELNIKLVALAHTLDDQAETMLFRLFRGSSLKGLEAMRSTRLHRGIILIRPMLNLRRAEGLAFLQEISVTPRIDKSNEDLKYSRNYIRAEVLPRIENRFPGFVERSEQMRRTIRDENEYWTELSSLILEQLDKTGSATQRVESEAATVPLECTTHWDGLLLRAQPIALLRRLVASAMNTREIEASFARVQKVCDMIAIAKPDRVSFNEFFDVAIDSCGNLIWHYKGTAENFVIPDTVVAVPGETKIPAAGVSLLIYALDGAASLQPFPHANDLNALVDLSNCVGPLTIRSKRADDVIRPFGMEVPVRLRKYLHTHKTSKTPNPTEPSRSVLLADVDEILWVPGVGLSEKLRVRGRPTHYLSIVRIV